MRRTTKSSPSAGWRLDELASTGRKNLDPTHVAHHDATMDAGARAEVRLLEELGLGTGSSVMTSSQ